MFPREGDRPKGGMLIDTVEKALDRWAFAADIRSVKLGTTEVFGETAGVFFSLSVLGRHGLEVIVEGLPFGAEIEGHRGIGEEEGELGAFQGRGFGLGSGCEVFDPDQGDGMDFFSAFGFGVKEFLKGVEEVGAGEGRQVGEAVFAAKEHLSGHDRVKSGAWAVGVQKARYRGGSAKEVARIDLGSEIVERDGKLLEQGGCDRLALAEKQGVAGLKLGGRGGFDRCEKTRLQEKIVFFDHGKPEIMGKIAEGRIDRPTFAGCSFGLGVCGRRLRCGGSYPPCWNGQEIQRKRRATLPFRPFEEASDTHKKQKGQASEGVGALEEARHGAAKRGHHRPQSGRKSVQRRRRPKKRRPKPAIR